MTMKYMGSKNRIAKHILPIMLMDRKPDQWWVEPFVGGANMIDKVDGKRLGNDCNKYLIALLKELQMQIPFEPPHIGEQEYKTIQHNKDKYPDWLVGYVGFNLSFAAKFFGGYRIKGWEYFAITEKGIFIDGELLIEGKLKLVKGIK